MRRALVLGCASCVWDDAKAAQALCPEFDLVIAVKRIGTEWPGRITHWVTLHPETFAAWQAARKAKGLNEDYRAGTWSGGKDRGARFDFRLGDWQGSSGLFAVRAAIEDGRADRVVLAGVPMTASPHYFRGKDWRYAATYQRGWKQHLKEFELKTRSMSGWTRTLLGAPDLAWLGLHTGRRTIMDEVKAAHEVVDGVVHAKDDGDAKLVFEAREDFANKHENGAESHYGKSLRYTLRPGNHELAKNLKRWLAEGKVRLVHPRETAQASAAGVGKVS
jgi:hypothetical protein